MLSTKFLVVFILLFIFQDGAESWQRMRRRRQCTPQDCQVSSWYPWNSCSASKCGRQGLQYRSRSVTRSASCGGGSCPELYESRQCYGNTAENCQLSSWSQWSACPAIRRDFPAIQTSTRHRITTEKCGGSCTTRFRKTRMCPRGPVNCKGYSEACCEKSPQGQTESGSGLSLGAIISIIFSVIFTIVSENVLVIWFIKRRNRSRREVAPARQLQVNQASIIFTAHC